MVEGSLLLEPFSTLNTLLSLNPSCVISQENERVKIKIGSGKLRSLFSKGSN